LVSKKILLEGNRLSYCVGKSFRAVVIKTGLHSKRKIVLDPELKWVE